jgi:serine phosphatase RsbU (regulator of sigma subunit)
VQRPLREGETIVITTDGVEDAMNVDGSLYTRERAREFLSRAPASAHARDLTAGLLADVRRHAGGRPQNDDITILSFGRVT